ncbi:hypothetical protein E3N88_01707 [Mikania micrantha]|uniref:Uncharacterized protein n=1 Tax=Mikania micrantha TaxID=192012 RepID=A0A5N6Q3M8_9ASTR|nr:hypothetical protein E3N88_01707 [Mikania micrantha]
MEVNVGIDMKVGNVGYSEVSKAYKLFNPNNHKVTISRDVIFDESKSWYDDDKTEGIAVINNESTALPIDQNEDLEDKNTTNQVNTHQSSSNLSNQSSSDSSDDDNEDSPNTSKKTRSISDLYANTRKLKPFADFALFADSDPITYNEACKDNKWRDAMNIEINSILKNDTWTLVDLPKGQKPIGVKWVYKTKLNKDGEIDKYKARLVVKGYKQKYGIDYQEVFAPVIRLETVRLVLALAAQYGWHVHQMDVKSAFLNGYLKEKVYIEQPEGYVKKGEEHKPEKKNSTAAKQSRESIPVNRKTTAGGHRSQPPLSPNTSITKKTDQNQTVRIDVAISITNMFSGYY